VGRAQGSRARGKQRRRRLGPATLVALLIHLQLGVMLGLLAYWKAPRNRDLSLDDAIAVTTLSDDASRALAADLDREEAERELRQADEQKKKEDEEKPNPDRQVVDIPTPRNQSPPKEARYAAEQDSTVEKETHHKGAPEHKTPPPQPPQPTLLAMREPSPPTPAQRKGAMGAPGAEPQPSGQDPQTESLPRPATPGAPGAPPTRPAPPQAVSLMPSQQTLSRALGGGGTSDYLPDIDEGDDTALNAKKWKFASFFNRVKEQIRQHWHAAQEYAKRDPTGSLYGGKVRFTVLIVRLMPDGSLADVSLERPSGVDFLDDVAVEAVKEAQPFPNPPQQLVDRAAGKISFRFGFVVDVEGETRLKVYRYSQM
jgi:TonB family protein